MEHTLNFGITPNFFFADTRNFAFTLAETLITLGIIGIVAALTIPNLIYSYKKKVYSSRLKEFYGMMTQAVQMSEITYGKKADWEVSPMDNYDEEGNLNTDKAKKHSYDYFKKYIAPNIKYTKETIKKTGSFNLLNGLTVYMWNGSCMDITVDVNGSKPPNKDGYDLYYFTICPNSQYPVIAGYGHDSNDREFLLKQCEIQPAYCTALLRYDNWEFKDDYPYKF